MDLVTPLTPAQQLGDEQFVRLTTFKRDGTPVPTTVWVALDGDDLVVTTLDTTGKAKRIRHTARVLLVPSSRTGEVEQGATDVEGAAVLFTDEPGLRRLGELLVEKYGLMARALFVGRKLTRKEEHRVGIRISLTA